MSLLGGVEHREIEDLDLRLDTALDHLAGHGLDELRMIVVDLRSEVYRAGRQRRHLRVQRQRPGPLRRIAAPAAGGELDDHPRAGFPDAVADGRKAPDVGG